MIIHKVNTAKAKLLYESITDIASEKEEYGNPAFGNSEFQMLEKYSHFVQNLIAFEKEIKRIENLESLFNSFTLYLKRIIPVKDVTLMFFDDVDNKLIPFNNKTASNIDKAMNNFNKEGVFKTVFSQNSSITIPDLESYNSSGPKLHYLILPVYEKNNYGILSVLTSLHKKNITTLEKKNISILLNILLGKVEKIKLTEKLNETYDELQTYQAKLSNDFRLSAIGEMTEGIIEDITTPLQVIVSNVDILSEETKPLTELKHIKNQTKKINRIINRLAKFADVNQKNIKLKSCNINNIIKNYFLLVKSTLENSNMECILDFDNNLPPILSNPNYIYQLLTNIFSILKNFKTQKSGVILQTRFKENNIYLRIISTIKFNTVNNIMENDQYGLVIKIIKNIMKKHEGAVEISSFNNGGTAISLKFPLKRKIRK